jgi:hypothetical protein
MEERSNDRLYYAAVGLNRIDVIDELKKGDANINAIFKDERGMLSTPLYEVLGSSKALYYRKLAVDIAEILILNGANASEKMRHGSTPLHMIAKRFPYTILLQRVFEMCPTTDANVKDDFCITPIAECIDDQKAWSECDPLCTDGILILLKHGADPSNKNRVGNTILHYCQDEAVISNVLEFNGGAFDINTRNSYGETPLFRGVKLHHNECPLLLDNDADPSIPDFWGDTILHLNIKTEFMSKILNSPFQVDINARNKNGSTPLHMHVLHKNPDGVRLLLRIGSDDTLRDSFGLTAEQLAADMYPDKNSPMRKIFFDNHVKLALCMGGHSRLGSDSWIGQLHPDLLEKIHEELGILNCRDI